MCTLTHFHTRSAKLYPDLFSYFTHRSTVCVILWLPFLEVKKQQEAGEMQRWWQPTFRIGFLLLTRPISRERWERSVNLNQSGKATHSTQLLFVVATVATGGTTYPDLLTHAHALMHIHTVWHRYAGTAVKRLRLSHYVSCHATCSACTDGYQRLTDGPQHRCIIWHHTTAFLKNSLFIIRADCKKKRTFPTWHPQTLHSKCNISMPLKNEK